MDRLPPGDTRNKPPPSVRTPLLIRAGRRNLSVSQRLSIASEPEELPHIGPFVANMRTEDINKYNIDSLSPIGLQSRAQKTAFAMCSLLYLRTYLQQGSPHGRDIWVRWNHETRGGIAARSVDTLVKQVWEYFVSEEGSPAEVEDVLWTEFPLYPDSQMSTRREFVCYALWDITPTTYSCRLPLSRRYSVLSGNAPVDTNESRGHMAIWTSRPTS